MPIKERRKFMRIATILEAEYWAKGPSMMTGQAQVRDFSRGGLGVLLPKEVAKGEHIDLTLKVPGDNMPIFATGEVTWTQSSEKERDRFWAGLKLLSIKPIDLARLLDHVYSRWLGGLRADSVSEVRQS